jgi:hypothetical protein
MVGKFACFFAVKFVLEYKINEIYQNKTINMEKKKKEKQIAIFEGKKIRCH